MSVEKPTIDVPESGPFLVKNLKKLTDSQDQPIEMAKDVIALCRCGASKNKPFCDGTHSDIGFTGAKERTETYGTKTFEGKELTVIDNRDVCCGAGECSRGAPGAFFRREAGERISEPDNQEKQKIIDTIRQCPSGSLAFMIEGELQDEFFSEPEIFVSKDGPLHVRGGIELTDDDKPVSRNHYTLCRCGASKNKPFCDGEHEDIEFRG